jgi:hypothetical protein
MNHAASLDDTAPLQQPDARGPMLGWGISLLIHALVAAWIWHAWLPHRAETDAGPVKRIKVWLVPIVPPVRLPPPTAPAPVPDARSLQTPAAPRPSPPPSQPHASTDPAEPPAIAPPPAADAADVTGAGTLTHAPAVDLAAARAAARLIAHEGGKGLVALPDRKPVVDPNADHHVVDPLERARRVDCQKARAESANLLANVVMLAVDLAKNAYDDSGCKW